MRLCKDDNGSVGESSRSSHLSLGHLPVAAGSPEWRVSLLAARSLAVPPGILPHCLYTSDDRTSVHPPWMAHGDTQEPPPSRRDSTHDQSSTALLRFLLPRCLVAYEAAPARAPDLDGRAPPPARRGLVWSPSSECGDTRRLARFTVPHLSSIVHHAVCIVHRASCIVHHVSSISPGVNVNVDVVTPRSTVHSLLLEDVTSGISSGARPRSKGGHRPTGGSWSSGLRPGYQPT